MARRTIIPDSDITSSTALNSASDASEARLGNNAAWVPDSTDVMPWIQVNLQQMKNVTGIVTQGWQGSYVKQYYVSYSEHGRNWRNHTVQGMTKVHGHLFYCSESNTSTRRVRNPGNPGKSRNLTVTFYRTIHSWKN